MTCLSNEGEFQKLFNTKHPWFDQETCIAGVQKSTPLADFH